MSYLCVLFFISCLTVIVTNHIAPLKLMHLFFVHCQISPNTFWVTTWMKKTNYLQKAKVQRQGVLLSFCLVFCQVRSGVSYKSVAYKKSVLCNLK